MVQQMQSQEIYQKYLNQRVTEAGEIESKIEGYSRYFSKYENHYVPTHSIGYFRRLPSPPQTAKNEEIKAYYKVIVLQFNDLSNMASRIIGCFDDGTHNLYPCVFKKAIYRDFDIFN